MNERNKKTRSILEKKIISLFSQFAANFFNALTQSSLPAISMLLAEKKMNKPQIERIAKMTQTMIQNNTTHQKISNNNEYEKQIVQKNIEEQKKQKNESKKNSSKNENSIDSKKQNETKQKQKKRKSTVQKN